MSTERYSAWIDGEEAACPGPAAGDPAAGRACAAWWLIGDVLRNEPALRCDFTSRVMEALDAEPTVLAPRAPQAPAANDAFTGRWMPVAAALAGVALVVWVAFSGNRQTEVAATALAEAAPVRSATAVRQLVQRDEDDHRAYLVAHQAYGPGAQMAGVAGYVRPVSLDQSVVASR